MNNESEKAAFDMAGINLKAGVIVTGVRPEIVLALFVASYIYAKYGKPLWVTSLLDGKHSETSLHYAGQAADLRTRYFDRPTQEAIVAELKEALGKNYDVILESNHIHMEYQPRYQAPTIH